MSEVFIITLFLSSVICFFRSSFFLYLVSSLVLCYLYRFVRYLFLPLFF